MRVVLDDNPFVRPGGSHPIGFQPWPARWINLAESPRPPFVAAYRCRFTAGEPRSVRLHVSADERYELFLDGERVGRGPERGDPRHWMFESYDVELTAGEHVLVARVHALGREGHLAPAAQMSLTPGFLLAADGELAGRINTGAGAWEAMRIGGYGFLPADTESAGIFSGGFQTLDGGAYPWGVERGEGGDWRPATATRDAWSGVTPYGEFWSTHRLRPAMLPAMLEVERAVASARAVRTLAAGEDPSRPFDEPAAADPAAAGWTAMLRGGEPVVVPAGARLQVVADLGDYYCYYPRLVTRGGRGSRVRVHAAEALFEPGGQPGDRTKSQRDRVEGLVFHGKGDAWRMGGVGDPRDGRESFEPLWWRCGRYVEFLIETGDEPLTVESWTIRETRYPLEVETGLACDEPRWEGAARPMVRALQMCAHETYMDCPYYEQLMYAGDTRLEVLTTYAVTGDDRLPRKAISAFGWSRLESGLTQARYPTHDTQVIPPFALWWVAMVHDFALWRDDAEFVRSMLPGVRGVLECYRAHVDERGLVGRVAGWNFVDWEPGWHARNAGSPPNAQDGPSGVIGWHYVLTLVMKADLEAWFGDPALAVRDRRAAQAAAKALGETFWDAGRGLYADDPGHAHYSEHAQCLALLTGLLPTAHRRKIAQNLFAAPDLARTTIYFSHYLFEACRLTGRMDVFFDRLEYWFTLPGQGFRTTPEMPEPSRSDCHAWGAHPLFHLRATVLGIRPTAAGFGEVTIRPQLGRLTHVAGSVAHPAGGEVFAEFRRDAASGRLTGEVRVPAGVGGVVVLESGEARPIENGGCVVG